MIAVACHTIIGYEDAFIDLAFELGEVEGFSAREVKNHIRFIADLRLVQLGLGRSTVSSAIHCPKWTTCRTQSNTPTFLKTTLPNTPAALRKTPGQRYLAEGSVSGQGTAP